MLPCILVNKDCRPTTVHNSSGHPLSFSVSWCWADLNVSFIFLLQATR